MGPLFNVILPPPFLSASLSASLDCALQNDFSKACRSGDVAIPSQLPGFDYSEEIIMGANGLRDLMADFFICDMLSVRDAQ